MQKLTGKRSGGGTVIEKDSSLKNILEEKIVLLTGAGGGIGLEAARVYNLQCKSQHDLCY